SSGGGLGAAAAPLDAGGRVADGYSASARVLRVVPVIGAPGGYPSAGAYGDPACTSRDYAGDYYGGGYRDDVYREPRRGSEGGRAMASVLGSVIGAVIGSQVGGGSARYAT